MLSMVYMAAYIVVGFLASWVIDHVGLRFGVIYINLLTLIDIVENRLQQELL